MDADAVILELVKRTAEDFTSYHKDAEQSQQAQTIVRMALGNDEAFASCRSQLEALIPDMDDDGSWEGSYALNAGCIMLCLIDYRQTGDRKHYDSAVTLFFDTVDFKVQQALEGEGVMNPTEAQIRDHALYCSEKEWYGEMKGA